MQPIRRGRIATTDGTFGVDDLDDVAGQNSLNGQPTAAFNVRERGTLPSGMRYAAGEVADRYEDRVKTTYISEDGDIDRTHEDTVIDRYAKWAIVPGEFAIAYDDFAFPHLMYNTPTWEVEKNVEIDLNAFRDAHPDANPSSFGIGYRGVADGATKGTLHGRNLYDDPDLGRELRDGTLVNELRVEYGWKDGNNVTRIVSAYLARSGYVEVYDPKFETEEFVDFVRDQIVPYVGETDDDEEAATEEASA